MALAATIVWEVRAGGSDTNGGGFKTGATGNDLTRFDAAQYSVTDGVTNGTTTITSPTANFGTDVVGNVMYVQGGTGSVVAGWYEITSRTNSTTVVVDRSTGLTAGTGVTLKIGGALASPAIACTNAVGGNIIYAKYHATPYTISSTSTNVSNGRISMAADPLSLVGYDATRSLGNTDANLPTLQASAISSTTLISGANNSSHYVRNIIVDGASLSTITGISFTSSFNRKVVVRCKAVNCTTGFGTVNPHLCWADNCTTGFSAGSPASFCYASNCPTGFSVSTQIIGCIANGCSTDGFLYSSFVGHCLNCTAYSCADGFDLNFTTYLAATNCLAYGNSAYGFRTGTGSFLFNCAAGNNSSGNTNSTPSLQSPTLVALSGDPFTNAGSGDFSLDITTAEGAACRAAGIPGSFFGPSTTGYLDIGAAQHQDAGGGSGGGRPGGGNMTGGF